MKNEPNADTTISEPSDTATAPLDADYRLDDQIGYLLRRAHQRATAIFQEHFPDLTPTQWALLARLDESGPVSQNQLGRMTAMDAATMQGVVRRLMDRDLIARGSDPGDRRRLRLRLTEGGREAVLTSRSKALAVSRETLSPLGPKERQTLLRLLERLT